MPPAPLGTAASPEWGAATLEATPAPLLRVAWCAPERATAPEPEETSRVGLELVRVGPQGTAAADIGLLDSRAYPDLAAMGDHGRRLGTPAVLAVAAEEVAAALAHLRPDDDVCLHLGPWVLTAHRLRATAQRAAERARARTTATDQLTGAGTRAGFYHGLEVALRQCGPERPLTLILVDLDLFKAINDTHGHALGDAVLREAARRLRGALGTLYRYGGEEFAAVHHADASDGLEAAERALEALRAEPLEGIRVTASAGVATSQGTEEPEAVLGRADEALYAAKARGRDRAVHHRHLQEHAFAHDTDLAIDGFENRTRVIAQRVAEAITQQGRRLFRRLREEADRDALTGLWSRRYLERRLPEELRRAGASGTPLVLVQLDVDDFGLVNKRHGWPTGDRVLRELATRLEAAVRATDWVARCGGDELFCVMPETQLPEAEVALERIRSALAARSYRTTGGLELRVTVSAAAVQSEPGEDARSLRERVAKRLLAAKGRRADQRARDSDARGHGGGEVEPAA